MRDPTVDYWADPGVERARRIFAFCLGVVVGVALAVVAYLVGFQCPPSS